MEMGLKMIAAIGDVVVVVVVVILVVLVVVIVVVVVVNYTIFYFICYNIYELSYLIYCCLTKGFNK